MPIGITIAHDGLPPEHDHLPRRYLAIIAGVAERLLGADDPAVMMDQLFANICDELRLDVFFDYRIDGERLVLEAHGGLTPHQAADSTVLEMGQAIGGAVARDRCRMHVTAIRSSDDPALAFARDIGLDSYVGMPMIHGDRLLGTLGFGRRWTPRFGVDELALLHTVCGYVAIAKHRLRIEAELRDGLERQERLLQELNHRVRNALQLAISIVGLEFRVPEADTPLAAKRRAVARLEVMATAHRPLYESDRLGEVDVATLLRGVAEQTVGHDVAVAADDGHSLSVERGVALALAVHAVLLDTADLRAIRVDRWATGDEWRLAITLSAASLGGAGSDEDAMPRSTRLLLRQLHATIDRDASGLTIHFTNGP